MAKLESILTPELLSEVLSVWYGHVSDGSSVILPSQDHVKVWFSSSPELDSVCVKSFGPVLDAIKESGVTSGQQILDAAKPKGPLDWLSLVLLLDQMPRNCYRGDASSVVYRLFDPLAQDVAAAASEKGIPDLEPQTRWFIGRRLWFYMPLEHSESLDLHRLATEKFASLARDIELLISDNDDPSSLIGGDDELRAKAARVLGASAESAEAARGVAKAFAAFEERHSDVIERFGRYPHRNGSLGRASTDEEIKYLSEGGETFGGGNGHTH
ncbi:Bacterial protein of unknown function (DUF924) [Geosmithia morbida]|uniref:Uncharacterized protein n=1 Tax=Geosmithia morbida TaxID=1094350 RepID=A0A9P5D0C6_9HYPO|nr:Bacterial protein of unknown function (DUF924) [Geosmithia morbida]KAF4119311.1 Bacterial protein of unknown function (DUF924) [Geosmithia morbida]